MTDQTPWAVKVGVSRAFPGLSPDGTPIVLLVPLGENGFLSALEAFLDEEVSRMKTLGRTDLPAEQQDALRKAIRWEWFTICYTIVTIALIALVVSGSQAMRTAWIEDMLSLVPQISFLVALLVIRRRPTLKHPYGLHRAMGVGHLVAGRRPAGDRCESGARIHLGLILGEHPRSGR